MPSRQHSDDAPVLTQTQAQSLGHKILRLTSADVVRIDVVNTVRRITRIANNRILTGNDGSNLDIWVSTRFGRRIPVSLNINQIDDSSLRGAIAQVEGVAREQSGPPVELIHFPEGPMEYIPVNNWYESTVKALRDRPTVVQALVEPVVSAGFTAAGFVGIVGTATYQLNRDGREAYYRETDAECNVSARTKDGKASGWHGIANRDWAKIHPETIAHIAVGVAARSVNAVALEPGRRTAIFSPVAVVQLVRYMTQAYDAYYTDLGFTPFSAPGYQNKLGQHVFDRRINFSTDPADPEGGCAPFSAFIGTPIPKVTWVENGTLVNLAYNPDYAAQKGKSPSSEVPWSFRMSGGNTTVEQMIASCQQGVLVNRISSVQQLDPKNGMITGVTRDGCFLVKDGKIDRPVKNFRFTDSPWFFLNKVISMGTPVRAAFGYSPPVTPVRDLNEQWPRRPIIVPPIMVEDFQFTSLADAV
jgi:predicted Zn-dependent protease